MFISKYYNKIAILFCLLGAVASSCNKALDTPSIEVASEEYHWRSISDTKSALIGIYGLMRAAMVTNNGHWIYGDVRGGDFTSYSRSDLKAVIDHNLKASYPLIQDLSNWRRFYAVVNAASLFIERAPEVLDHDTRYTKNNLAMDVAQARAIRAFAYFYMVRIWGDVPLITKSYDNGSFYQFAKTDQRAVLNFAESELIDAVEFLPYRYGLLPQVYYGSFASEWQKILFNKISAYAVLAHIAAWQGKYIDVDSYTKFIVDNYSQANVVRLTNITATGATSAGLTGNFGIFSNNYGFGQIINFSSAYVYGEATPSGHIEQLTLAQPVVNKQFPDIYVDKNLITDLFDDINDRRFGLDTVSGLYRTNYFQNFTNEVPIFTKISVLRDGINDGNYAIFGSNLVFTRLEEIHLLRAEALAVLGKRTEAIDQLNIVKSMRFIENYLSISDKPLIGEIFAERRRELMGEGWRFYDQVRYNRITGADPDIVALNESGGIYWPIAQEILNSNRELVQNNYWN